MSEAPPEGLVPVLDSEGNTIYVRPELRDQQQADQAEEDA